MISQREDREGVDRPLGASVLVDGVRLMRRFLWRGLAYSLIVDVAAAVVFGPLIAWSFYRMLAVSGEPVRLNHDLVDLFLTPRLLLGLLWAPVLAWMALVGVGGLVVLAAASHRGDWLSLRSTVLRVIRRLPLVRGVAVLKAVLYFIVAVPVIGGVASGVVSGTLLSFPSSPVFQIVPFTVALGIVIGVVIVASTVVALWLTVRWCFVSLGVVVEGLALGAAFRRSVEMGRGHRWELLRMTVGSMLIVAAALGGATGVLAAVNVVVVRLAAGIPEVVFAWIAALLITVDVGILAALLAVGGMWLVSVNTVAFFRLHPDAGPDAGDGAGPHGLEGEVVPPEAPAHVRAWIVAAVVVALLASAVTVPGVLGSVRTIHQDVKVTAHRGSALRTPENTLPAMRAAIEDGADYAEIDIQQASDGGLVLMHDLTLARTTGRPEGVWQLTTDQLTAIDAGSWFSEDFAGETIPTLAEVIETVRGGCRLNIEVKLHGRERDLARALVDLLREKAFTEDCVVTSLDQGILAEVRALAPEVRVGAIITASVGNVGSLDVDMFAVAPMLATPRFVASAHRQGREVHVWSLKEPGVMNMVIDRGVDGILSADPALARRVIESRTPADDMRALLVRLFGHAGRTAPMPEGVE